MKLLNRYLLFFFVLVAILFFGINQILQSSAFGEKISEKISDQFFSKLDLNVKFDGIEIGLFPPSSTFKKVELVSTDHAKFKLKVFATSLGIQFGFLDFFSNQYSINKISLFDANVILETPEKDKDSKDFDLEDIKKIQFSELFKNYRQEIYEKIPLRIKNLEFNKVDLDIDSKRFFIDSFLLGIFSTKLKAKGTIENENLIMFSALYPGEQEVDFDFEMTSKGALIKTLKFKNRQDSIGLKGKIKNGIKDLELDGEIEYFGRMETMARAFPQFGELKKMFGIIDGKSTVKNALLNPDMDFKLTITDFTSRYVDLDKVLLEGQKIGNKFVFKTLKGTNSQATLELTKPIEFEEISKVDLGQLTIPLKINEFFSNKLLKFVDVLDPIKAYLTGDFDIQLEKNKLNFVVKDGFSARDFKLLFPDTIKPLLENNLITLTNFKVSVLENDNVQVQGNLNFKDSSLAIKGTVLDAEEALEFTAKSDPIFNFLDLGPISGVNLKGSGPFSILVHGPTNNVIIDFDTELEDFGFLGFSFGNSLGKLTYNINKKTLSVPKFESIFNNSEIFGYGDITFGDNSNANFHVVTPKITYQDSLIIYKPLVEDISWLKQNDNFDYLADYKVTGPLDPKKLTVKGSFKGGENTIFGEELNSFEGKYSYQNQKIKISNLIVNNGKGKVFVNINYDVPSTDFNFTAETNGMRLTDFEKLNQLNFGIDGELLGNFKGERKSGIFNSNSKLSLINTRIGSQEIEDSSLEIKSEGKKVNLSGEFLGDYFVLKSFVNTESGKAEKQSSLDLKIRIQKLEYIFGIISGHNILNSNLGGQVFADINTSFDLNNLSLFNGNLKLSKFDYRNENLEMSLKERSSSIIVKDGTINEWDVYLNGSRNSFISKGEGSFAKKFKISNEFKLDGENFLILSPNIQQISGHMKGNFSVVGDGKSVESYLRFFSEIEKLKLQIIPGSFEDFKLDFSQKNSELKIERLKGKYGKGEVNANGGLKFRKGYPELNINYDLINIDFPFFKKSTVNLSGKGIIQGASIPYDLTGDFLVGYGKIEDTLTDLMAGQTTGVSYNKWLPKRSGFREIPLVNLNIKIDLANRMELKNKSSEIKFGGSLEITGNNQERILNGNLNAIPGQSKFFFKGNEFVISEGYAEFYNFPNESPLIRLAGTSQIKKYDVRVGVSGRANKPTVDFSSDPPLSKQDILSLITLGFTSKDAVGLKEDERETMTSVGFGSLLADQLNLSEGLTSDFGIKLSVTPELQEEEKTSQPETRQGSVLPTQSKFKSATRIGFKKQVSENIDISFSNTVGGSIDQKQVVSGEYYLNKNTSFRGTYEMFDSSSREIQDSGAQSNNIGLDLIFKWSFK